MQSARHFHAVALLLFLVFWIQAAPPLGVLTLLGITATGMLLTRQHDMLRPDDLSQINKAFFTINGQISLVLFFCAWVDTVVLTTP